MYVTSTKGYSSSATQYSKGFLDYIPSSPIGYYADAIQENIGRLDYLIGNTGFYSNVIIEQSSGWQVNWELIDMQWETIDNLWQS
jgi:hypothetical protein